MQEPTDAFIWAYKSVNVIFRCGSCIYCLSNIAAVLRHYISSFIFSLQLVHLIAREVSTLCRLL